MRRISAERRGRQRDPGGLSQQFDLIAGGNINLTSGCEHPGAGFGRRRHSDPPAAASAGPSTSTTTASQPRRFRSSRRAARRRRNDLGTRTTNSRATSVNGHARGRTVDNRHERTGSPPHTLATETQAQTLTSISGTFTPARNIVEPLPAGQPPQTIPPAPPGIIFKVNRINGSSTAPINLLTDPKIFGYDPTTGQLIRFDLNLTTNTGAVDPDLHADQRAGRPGIRGL